MSSLHKKLRTADQDAWESTRMHSAGLGGRAGGFAYITEEDEKAMVSVRTNLPSFLDGQSTFFTKQQEPVSVVRDPTSDIAVLAREGSTVVRQSRAEQDRSKMKDRFWEVAGSRVGELLGVSGPTDTVGEMEDADDSVPFSSLLHSDLSSAQRAQIYDQRRSLPIFQCKSELMRVIRDHQVIVVVGMTGSGKTTQLGQYFFEAGFHTQGGLIGCTQPRRVAAVSVAKRVADEMGCELGSTVGYSIRFEDVTSAETRIKFMTDGVLLREALNDAELEKYSVVIMDEAHERSVNTDVLFGILKKVAESRSDFKLIVTSATMDSEKFARYFKGSPVFSIPGRTFPVETYFAKTNSKDYVESAVDQVLSVHLTQPLPGDILVFMTGQDDIETTCVLLADRIDRILAGENANRMTPLTILPIYSQLPASLQSKIFEPSPYRKVIVATNIAETSLTIDGIKFVIDAGFCKLKVYNPKIGMDTLFITPISRANADQRKGRAGRQSPGTCWRLYTEQTFVYDLLENTIPEIQRTNLPNVVLLLKSLGVDNLLQFDFMDPPPHATILNAMHQLWLLEALDDQGRLSETGKLMAEFPLDPALSKLIVSGLNFFCVAETVAIVAMLTVPSIFYRPKDRAEEADAARQKFFVPESDHLTLLNVHEQYLRNGKSAAWCSRHFIQSKSMKRVQDIRQQVEDILRSRRIRLSSCGGTAGDLDRVRKAVGVSYFHNVAKLRGIGEYVNMLTSVPCHLHPTSALHGLGHTPEYIVYHEVVKTSKEYMQCVTAVEPDWLEECGGRFFTIKYPDGRRGRHVGNVEKKGVETPFLDPPIVEKPALEKKPILPTTVAQQEVSASDSDTGQQRRLKNRNRRRDNL